MPDSRVSPAAPAAVSPAERKRRRRTFWGNVYLAVCVAAGAGLLAVAPRLADESRPAIPRMGPVGLFLGAFMLVILLVRGRPWPRHHAQPRDGHVWDERDRAVKRRTWALAGKAAFTFLFILLVMSFTLFPLFWLIRMGFPVYTIIVVSARFYGWN